MSHPPSWDTFHYHFCVHTAQGSVPTQGFALNIWGFVLTTCGPWRVVSGCCSRKVLGHPVGVIVRVWWVGGKLDILIPTPLEGQTNVFFFTLNWIVKFCWIFFSSYFLLNFCSNYGISFLCVYSFPFFFPLFFLLGLWGLSPKGGALSWSTPGCVTCHTRHASVTHFRPILGNIVEVTLVTSPLMYIISHTKGTGFPLARITTMTPP